MNIIAKIKAIHKLISAELKNIYSYTHTENIYKNINNYVCRDIRPEEEAIMEHRFTPYQTGEHKIVATFTSKQLLDITGSATLDIID